MTGLSLFTGAGGADLGLAEAGVDVVRGVENDPDAVATCHAAGLDYVRLGDVRDLTHYEGLPPIDLLFGGPPCQAFSTAGQRQGQDDDRNGWPWTLEVIDHVRPRWVLLENVPGLLSHSGDCRHPCPGCYWTGELLPAFRARFPWMDYRTINASSYGVPQHRRRVFLVCGPCPIRWPEATHGDPTTLKQSDLFGRKLKPWLTMADALGLTAGALDGGRNSTANPTQERPASVNEPAPTVGGRGNAMLNMPSQSVTLTHRSNGSRGIIVIDKDKPAPTVQAGSHRDNGFRIYGGEGQKTGERRRLTVDECARLQDFKNHPWQGNKEQRYRQVGNAWPRAFGRVLGRALLEAEERL